MTAEYQSLVRWMLSVEDAQPLQTHTRHLGGDGLYDLSPMFIMWLDQPESIVTYTDGRRDYRWPLRAAQTRLDRMSVPSILPRYGRALRALEICNGDLQSTSSRLSADYPVCGDLTVLQTHLLTGLRYLQQTYQISVDRGRF